MELHSTSVIPSFALLSIRFFSLLTHLNSQNTLSNLVYIGLKVIAKLKSTSDRKEQSFIMVDFAKYSFLKNIKQSFDFYPLGK